MKSHMIRLAVGWLVFGASAAPAFAQYSIVNIIPNRYSGEQDQNAEPSIAVNPANQAQGLIGSFSSPGTVVPSAPIFTSGNLPLSWNFLEAIPHGDQTYDWSPGGTAYGAYLSFPPAAAGRNLSVSSSTDPIGGKMFTALNPAGNRTVNLASSIINDASLDQPWVCVQRRGLADRVYVSFNVARSAANVLAPSGYTYFSLDSGNTWSIPPIQLDTAPGAKYEQDSASVRVAASGDRVYVAFERWFNDATKWTPPLPGIKNDETAQVIVMRDDNAGLGTGAAGSAFMVLGAQGANVTKAYPGGLVSVPCSLPAYTDGTSLGRERLGSDVSIAIDPRNPDQLYVAWAQLDPPTNTPVPFVHVAYSTDGAQSWQEVFKAPIASAMPGLAVAANGTVGLIYTALNPANQNLETHFVQASSGFTPVMSDDVLSSFLNNTPAGSGNPYIGDYENLKALGLVFHGTFSASGEPDGSHFPQGVYFQRNVALGGVLTNNFLLSTNVAGKLVGPISTNIVPVTNQWVQIPDTSTNGLDVGTWNPLIVADDFLSTATGPITQITIWGSWLTNNVTATPFFNVYIYADVPASNGVPSHPGAQLWASPAFQVPNAAATNVYANGVNETFIDPRLAGTNSILGPDNAIWQYTFNIATNNAFFQTKGSNYWLCVNAFTGGNSFGWKTCPTNWNDGAVYATTSSGTPISPAKWQPVVRPGTTNVVNLAFAIGSGGPTMGTNVGFSIDPFYFSTAAKPNQNLSWSQLPGYLGYPLDPTSRGADRESDLNLNSPPSPNIVADDFVAQGTTIRRVRWWGSYFNGLDYPVEDGYLLSFFSDKPANGGNPSTPDKLLATYIAPIRVVRVAGSSYLGCDGLPIYQYEVDLRDSTTNYLAGTNGLPTGFKGASNSVYWLSIAAYAGGTLNAATGVLATNGSPRTTNSHFWGWHTSPVQTNDVSVTGRLEITNNPWPYSAWASNGPLCTAQEVDQAFALYTDLGTVAPPLTFDATSLPNMKWLQRPNLTTLGMDVLATDGSPVPIVADDFLCTNSGALIGFHLWGSWLGDQFDPNARFRLALWQDTPGTTNAPSHPGQRLWLGTFTNGPTTKPFSYTVTVEASGINYERFYDPSHPAFAGTDTTVYRYDFYVPTNQAFYQVSNTVYWLSANALTPNPFGWKTAVTNDHHLDAATWSSVNAPATNQWSRLLYPSNHLYSAAAVDLAFAIRSVYVTPPAPPVTNIAVVGKWLQRPDTSTNGLDVRATLPKILADDFLCTTSGPITKIDLWGSWLNDIDDATPQFCLGIWSDVPAVAGFPSHPGNLLWSECFGPGEYYYEPYAQSSEQFYDPDLGNNLLAIIGGDNNVWHYQFPVALTNAFRQTNGTVYWLSLTAQVSDTNFFLFGWKTSPTNWNDSAVFNDVDDAGDLTGPWQELFRPGTANGLDLSFALSDTIISTNPPPPPPPPYIPTNYLVQWSQTPAYLRGSAPAGGDQPSDFVWGAGGPWPWPASPNTWQAIADDWQADGRSILGLRWWGSYLNHYPPNVVDGFVLSFFADGHPGGGEPDEGLVGAGGTGDGGQPIELLGSYVVPSSAVKLTDTGETGADGAEIFQYEASLANGCVYVPGPNLSPGSFQTTAGTVYWVSIQAEAGMQFSRTTDFFGAPACDSTATTNNPIFDFWGWHTAPCQQLSSSANAAFDNVGTDWQYYDWMNNDVFYGEIDQAFETLVDSTVAPPAPVSTSLTGLTWLQRPDLTPQGLSMLATLGQNSTEVADDFSLTVGMPLTSIKIWGAWLNDQMDPNAIFLLSIWTNSPAATQPGAAPLWQGYFTNIFSYQVFPETPTVCGEPFFDPSSNAVVGVDSQVYRYEFHEPAASAFIPAPGAVYWLSVSALHTANSFGWKTAAPYDHFDANAVWFSVPDWDALLYPAAHAYASRTTNTLDMAFALTTGCTDVDPPEPVSTLQDDGTVMISWPDTGDCFYVLQGTPQLNPPTWTAVPLTTPTSLVVAPTNNAMFYRLFKP